MSLETLKYLETKSLDDLSKELSIIVARHSSLPLAILNYHQLDSPKAHPVVRECRGLVIDTETIQMVAKPFSRFYEWGELAHEMPLFNFNNCYATSKEDGSLIVLYNYKNKWMANTRGSFGEQAVSRNVSITWQEAILQATNSTDLQHLTLDPTLAYVFELCTPWNEVVRKYDKPAMYHLATFHGINEVNAVLESPFLTPERYHFKSINEVFTYLFDRAKSDPTFEGVVLCDDGGRRWKVKSPTWKALQQIKGSNLHPRYFVPFIVYGGKEELLGRYPQYAEYLGKIELVVSKAWEELAALWESTKHIEGQREFALVSRNKTQFQSLMFEMRKSGEKDLEKLRLLFLNEKTVEKLASMVPKL